MKSRRPIPLPLCLSLCSLCLCGESSLLASDPLPEFERIVIDDNFPGGYQVEVADVNGDHRPDIVGLGNGHCAWFENPTWKKRVVTGPDRTPGIISTATADLNGDGKAEIAIAFEFAMNQPARGKLALARQGKTVDDPWTLEPIADVGSIHRLRWGGRDPQGRRSILVVAPIFGAAARGPTFDQEPARLLIFQNYAEEDGKPATWHSRVLAERPVIHAIEVQERGSGPEPGGGPLSILTADNLGVARVLPAPRRGPHYSAGTLIPGEPGPAPKRGSSEVHLGRLADGRRFLATIDPWHGSKVAISTTLPGQDRSWHFGPRTVIDDTLDDGHALWVADVDGDGDDEVFAGHRGKDHRVSAFDFDVKAWNRTVLDREVAAQDLRGGDLDGDGRPDVVAIGGQTHNIIWYRPSGPGPRPRD